jgi:competence protein ComEA
MIARATVALLLLASSATARAAPPAHAPATSAAATAPARSAVEGVVNINDAPQETLVLLPGIGPAKARAIAEHRRAHPFHRVDELLKVKGIGRRIFGHLRPFVAVAGQTTLTQEVKLRR